MADKGVSTRVARDYYRVLEKTRHVLKSKYRIKVASHKKLTELMCHAPPLYANKAWITKIKRLSK